MVRALIKVGYGCNDHCTFCHTLLVRHIDDTGERVDRKIDRAAALGHSMVVLSGGEPTIRPELLRWARRTAAHGMDFGLVTNGRVLSYKDRTDELLRSRLRYVYLSLHGGTAKVHNACVRSDAFDQSFGAVGRLSGQGVELTVNCVITQTNLPHLRGLVDLLLPFDDVTLQFSMTEAKGGGDRLFDRIVPRVTDVAEAVVDAIQYGLGRRSDGGLAFAHGGIPFCLLPGFEGLYGDLRTHGFSTMTEVWEEDFHPIDDLNKVQPEPCRGCALRGPCPGLYTGYMDRLGDAELRPVSAPRSNSFHYVPRRTLTWSEGAACPVLRSGVTPWSQGRAVFLRRGGRMVLFETGTRDFADVEIAEIKGTHGQLYLDVSDKAAADDFPVDLRKLTPVEECASCPEQARCATCYEVTDEDVFTRDDGALRTRLSGMRGDVLDVGCGDGRYAQALAPSVEAGDVRYRGVDPDAEAVAALRARLPWADVEVLDVADLALDPGSLDHVLMLQSWNHLEEPDVVLESLVGALKPGGTLLVADNVAFGLLRTEGQAARAEGGPAGFEHWRNDAAADANRLLAELPVTLMSRRDVSPGTSNQWFLHYERQGDES